MSGVSDSGEQQIEYELRIRLPDGREEPSGSFTTRRARAVGDVVNLPTGPDKKSRPGKGYVWRVARIEDGGRMLVLDYEAPQPEMDSLDQPR